MQSKILNNILKTNHLYISLLQELLTIVNVNQLIKWFSYVENIISGPLQQMHNIFTHVKCTWVCWEYLYFNLGYQKGV